MHSVERILFELYAISSRDARFQTLEFHLFVQMAFGHTYQELKNMSKDELINYYDDGKGTTKKDIIVLNELKHREDAEHQKAIEDLTRTMRNLTLAILFLTLVNVGAILINLLI